MDEHFSKMVRPMAGLLLVLILFQGASGAQLTNGTDWGHKHSSYLTTLVAVMMPVVVVKTRLDDSSLKGNAFAVAGIGVVQFLVGTFMLSGHWQDWGWLHVPLAMVMSAHAFAILILSRRAIVAEA